MIKLSYGLTKKLWGIFIELKLDYSKYTFECNTKRDCSRAFMIRNPISAATLLKWNKILQLLGFVTPFDYFLPWSEHFTNNAYILKIFYNTYHPDFAENIGNVGRSRKFVLKTQSIEKWMKCTHTMFNAKYWYDIGTGIIFNHNGNKS